MQNFIFHNPVKIYFGQGQIASLCEAIPSNKAIMVTYGKGSIKKNGVYDQVMSALQKSMPKKIIEFAGIEANPQYTNLMQAVNLARNEKIDFLLAVGGGSVIDGTKFISAAINFPNEPWDVVANSAQIINPVPFATILTLPGTGSEMNCGSVISKADIAHKLPFSDPKLFPQFSILDPSVTYSLPTNQTCNGIVDAFVHVIEQYLTHYSEAPLLDRFAEGIMLNLIEEGQKVLRFPNNYNVRANIMWCATLALNGLLSTGVPTDWATHSLGHELTAMFGLDHAQALAVLLPNLLRVRKQTKHYKLLQFATRIFNITEGSNDERIENAITKIEEFFKTMNMKTRLSDYGISGEAIPEIMKNLHKHDRTVLGEDAGVTLEISEEIFRRSL